MTSSAWLQIPENKSKHDAYMRAYGKEYEQRPYVKARRKEQYQNKKDKILAKYRNDPVYRKSQIDAVVRRKRNKQIEMAGRVPPNYCEVCGNPSLSNKRPYLMFDHDHVTGKFRGWICDNCNKALGHAKDDPKLLRKLAEYLEKANGL